MYQYQQHEMKKRERKKWRNEHFTLSNMGVLTLESLLQVEVLIWLCENQAALFTL